MASSDHANRIFLDTNILLDVLLDRPGLAVDSGAALLRCEALGVRLFVSWHGLATAYYLIRRGRSEENALREVDLILSWATVASVGDADARKARQWAFSDFEDALQAAAAESCNADWILTNNTCDFQASPIPAICPSDFIALAGPAR